ncbi:hypothetical protein [Dysgonomonas sp. ZJ709]|uniref:DUF7688 family protein n=1 Tax=Dysgonomonas sp. ZJ709 TaxID=2709797 RepID=UPI0013ED2208|nr:hypothetical protein [Dysgonomonas sp. ZJ709]
MKQEIRQNGETIIESDDTIFIPFIFGNLTGRSSNNIKEFKTYIEYKTIPLMKFQYGKFEFWQDGKLTKTGYITKLLLIT